MTRPENQLERIGLAMVAVFASHEGERIGDCGVAQACRVVDNNWCVENTREPVNSEGVGPLAIHRRIDRD